MFLSPVLAARLAGLTVLVSGLAPFAPAGAAACRDGGYTESGTCAPVVADPAMTASQRSQQESKNSQLAAMNGLTGESPSGFRVDSTRPDDGTPTPTPAAYQLPEVQAMTIYREGEGNGRKAYTCGPSATRNMVAAMYKRKYGNSPYAAYGEHQFEIWEGTTTDGTARANVAATLNAHFGSYGHWTTSRPATATAYFNAVKIDTYVYHQSVIANVDTEELSFFKGHQLNHFDFVYGYALDGSQHYLYVGEEWDPVYIFGSSSYQPYGRHRELLTKAFSAISKTAIHGIVS